MNKSYRSLWNESLGAWVAASELTRARGKRSSARVIAAAIVAAAALGGLSGLASAAVIGTPAQAQDGTYSSGAASATAGDSTAVGAGSKASAQGATAVGAASHASGYNATAVGIESVASGDQSLALGYKAHSSGLSSTAIGAHATAAGIQSIAMGISATVAVDATNALAFGTLANAGAVGAIALGSRAVGSGVSSVAIGVSAHATADNSVALGAKSTTTAALGVAGYNAGTSVLAGVASAANGEVSMGSAGNERRVTNIAAGAAGTDAVNVSQLQSLAVKSGNTASTLASALGGGSAVNADGTVSTPSYSVGGTTFNNVGSALGNIDGRVTTNTTNIAGNTTAITNLANNVNNGTVGLVKQDATTKDITVAADKAGTLVSIAGTDGDRTLGGVKAGALNATSSEAVNGAQLFATNEQVGVNTTNIAGNTTAINNLGDRVTTVEGSVDNLTNNLNSGSVGLVKQDATTKAITVAADKAGTSVNFTGTEGARTLSGVKDGTLAAGSTEAVNGGQLFTTNQNVAANTANIATNTTNIAGNTTAITNLDGRTTTNTANIATNTTDITNLTNNLSSGSVGLVKQDATTKDITVAADKAGTLVNIAGTEGARTLSGVKDGTLAAGSTEAVNGGQLFATNQNVAANTANIATNTTNIAGNTTAITNLDGRVTSNTGDIADLKNGASGLVQQDAATRTITVAKDTDGTSVDFTGTAGARTLTGVAAGAVNATSLDAINGSQLHGVSSSVANALGGGSTVNTNGTVSAPSYAVGGTTVHNVGDAITNLDGRTTTNAQEIAALNENMSGSSDGLVKQDATTRAITVAKDTDGTSVDFTGTGGPRTLTGVAAGAVNATSLDAINGSQLHGVSSSVASALGGGASVAADGSIVAPTYTVNNATYSNVSDALQGLAGNVKDAGARLTVVQKVTSTSDANSHVATSGDASNAAVASGDNAVAVGAGATASARNSVALGAGSTTGNRENVVSVGSVGNERAIANVADAVADTDAVNKRQLDSVSESNRAYTDQRLNQVQSDIASVKRDSNAAAASAMAVATLPQSILPGRGMASAAVSNMDGESAVAVGISKVAENGRWVTKVAGTVNTRGNAGVSAGIGFHW